jgi:HAD superfamily hydrolase (TIGR01459 family)
MTQIVPSLADISDTYDVLLCDLWGCVHDGVKPFAAAIAALQGFRQAGKTVVLLTNAPRDRRSVEAHLTSMGLPTDAWDTIATSGDAARAAMFTGAVGEKVWFMGEDRDRDYFRPMEIIENPVDLERVELDAAEGIVCCGPFDPLADPEELRPQLMRAREKGLKLLCANPDIVVDRGETREWCAGAVAALYTEIGGESLYFGKPHPPIYDLARRRLAALGVEVPAHRILAVGDGIMTDIKGAEDEHIDSLFITGGLARAETRTTDQPEPEALERYIADHGVTPTYAIGALR